MHLTITDGGKSHPIAANANGCVRIIILVNYIDRHFLNISYNLEDAIIIFFNAEYTI